MQLLARMMRWTVGLLSGLAVLAVVAYAMLFALGFRPVAVYSGSMRPVLGVGSLAVVRPVDAATLRVGDVITFSDPYDTGRLITHRIARIVERPEGRAYRTKGDANPARDPWAIALPAEAGKLSFSVPYVGYALVYARTREVRLATLIGGCLLVLVALLRSIWRAPVPKLSESV